MALCKLYLNFSAAKQADLYTFSSLSILSEILVLFIHSTLRDNNIKKEYLNEYIDVNINSYNINTLCRNNKDSIWKVKCAL